MAILKKTSLLNVLSGALGKEIVIKQYADKVVVAKYPDMSKVKPTVLQLQSRQRMKEATVYAQLVLRDPVLRAEIEKDLRPGESVYHKAKKEYFTRLKK